MPYGKFDPKGERSKETRSLLREEKTSGFKIFLQLLGIFILLRVVMLAMGMPFFWIPYFDNFVVKIVHLFMPQ